MAAEEDTTLPCRRIRLRGFRNDDYHGPRILHSEERERKILEHQKRIQYELSRN